MRSLGMHWPATGTAIPSSSCECCKGLHPTLAIDVQDRSRLLPSSHLKRWPLLSHALQRRHWLLTWKTLSWDGVFGPHLDFQQSRYGVDKCTSGAAPGRSPVKRYRCYASTRRRCNSPKQLNAQCPIPNVLNTLTIFAIQLLQIGN